MINKKTALVTGSAQGLGKAMAAHLVHLGYAIVIHYNKSKEPAARFRQEVIAAGGQAITQQADVTNPEAVRQMFSQVDNIWGRLDLLVNNVGNYIKKPLTSTTIEEWGEMLNSNLNSVFYCIHHALPLLAQGKTSQTRHIVNIGFASLGQATAKPQITPYYIAKNGVLNLTKSLALELAPQNINVNMLSPGVLENSESKPIHEIPKGRVATFDEFNHVLEMLLTTRGHYLTGVNIEVAGGWKL